MSILMKLGARLAGTQLRVAPRRVTLPGRMAVSTKANLTKGELIEEVAQKTNITPKQATAAVNLVLQTIVNSVAKGEKVVLPGFGTFEQRIRAARKGRNPRTGEALDIPESKAPAFSPGKTFKDVVKGVNK